MTINQTNYLFVSKLSAFNLDKEHTHSGGCNGQNSNDLVAGETGKTTGCSECTACDVSPEEAPNQIKPTEQVPRIVVNPPADNQNVYSSDYNSYSSDSDVDDSDSSDSSDDANTDVGADNEYDYDSYDSEPLPEDLEMEIEANWAFWSSWSTCDVECSANGNTGSQSRKRECTYDDGSPAQVGQGNCNVGSDIKLRPCNPTPPPCSKWAEWGYWSRCSTSCGGGIRQRQRSCMYGGRCDGEKEQVQQW